MMILKTLLGHSVQNIFFALIKKIFLQTLVGVGVVYIIHQLSSKSQSKVFPCTNGLGYIIQIK